METRYRLNTAILTNLKVQRCSSTGESATRLSDVIFSLTNLPLLKCYVSRLTQLLLRAIRSPKRPLFHLLRAWALVSQHLVDTCCFSSVYDSTSFGSDAERLLISQRALACLHECTITAITTRLELPYFSVNEMFCKPFEILLRLGMYPHRVVPALGGLFLMPKVFKLWSL